MKKGREYWAERKHLIDAYVAGETLQLRGAGWQDVSPQGGLSFDFPVTDYRIKPKPQKRWVRWVKRKGDNDWIFDGWAVTEQAARNWNCSDNFDVFISEVEINT